MMGRPLFDTHRHQEFLRVAQDAFLPLMARSYTIDHAHSGSAPTYDLVQISGRNWVIHLSADWRDETVDCDIRRVSDAQRQPTPLLQYLIDTHGFRGRIGKPIAGSPAFRDALDQLVTEYAEAIRSWAPEILADAS